MKVTKQKSGDRSRTDVWTLYAKPRIGHVHGLDNLNGELVASRGAMGILRLSSGKEVDIHLDHFIPAGRQ